MPLRPQVYTPANGLGIRIPSFVQARGLANHVRGEGRGSEVCITACSQISEWFHRSPGVPSHARPGQPVCE